MNMTDRMMNSQEQTAGSHWVDTLWFRILLITSLGLGIFFRLAGLGNKIYSHDEAYASLRSAGYRGGEVFTSLWDGTDKTVEDLQRFLKPGDDKTITDTLFITASSGPHQGPLFYLLAHYWMRIIGYTPAAMRGLAAAFGILSILAMYWLGRELFRSTPIALLSTALFAISPFYILFAQDARPYSLWTLAVLLSNAALLRAMQKNNKVAWLIYSITLIIGLYSQLLMILVIIVHGLYFMFMHSLPFNKRYVGLIFAFLLALLAYLPWLFWLLTRWQVAAGQLDWLNIEFPWYRYIQKWLLFFSSPFLDLDFTSGNLIAYLLRALMLLFIAYTILFFVKHAPRRHWTFILITYAITAGAFIVPDMLLGGMRSMSGRYFAAANLATILVVAFFLTNKLDQAGPNGSKKWGFLIGLLMTAGLISNVNSLLAETWWNKELGRIRPEFVHEVNREQTLLIVSGNYPTNVGDMLSLGFDVNTDVHIRLYEDPDELRYADGYQSVYWFPSSYKEVQEISKKERLQVREVLPGALWQIEGKLE